jgi:hypothetical protein
VDWRGSGGLHAWLHVRVLFEVGLFKVEGQGGFARPASGLGEAFADHCPALLGRLRDRSGAEGRCGRGHAEPNSEDVR